MRRSVFVSALLVSLAACAAEPDVRPPAKLLGNPVLDARAALAAGDSTFLGLLDPELVMPGLEGMAVSAEAEPTVRVFSKRSLGLSSEGWRAQRDSLRVYTAAYNRLIAEARQATARGAI